MNYHFNRDKLETQATCNMDYDQLTRFFSCCRCIKAEHFSLIFSATSAIAFAFGQFFISLAEFDTSPFLVILICFTTVLLITLVIILITESEFYPQVEDIWWVTLAVIFQDIWITCLVYSITFIPPAEASVICNSSPVFTAVIACIFLNERLSFYDVVVLITSIVGVLLVAQPCFLFSTHVHENSTERVFGICFALAAALSNAIFSCLNRKIEKTSALTTTFNMSVVTVLSSSACYYIAGSFTAIGKIQLLYSAGSGIAITATVVLLCMALQLGNAAFVNVIHVADAPVVLLLQISFLGKVTNVVGIIGMLLVVLSGVFLGLKQILLERLGQNVCC
ncbi:SLC35G1 (predicted) [Pycnogonum litorale]